MGKGSKNLRSVMDSNTPGGAVQTAMLFARELQGMRRNTLALAARFGLSALLGTLIGVIFFRVGSPNDDPSAAMTAQRLQSQFGATISTLVCLPCICLA